MGCANGRSSKRMPPAVEVLLVLLCTIVVPVLLLTFVASAWVVKIIEASYVGMLVTISALSFVDFVCALPFPGGAHGSEAAPQKMGERQPLLDCRYPEKELSDSEISFSIVVPAYLPNESMVIMQTLDSLLRGICYSKPYQVVVVYNMRPEDETDDLRRLAEGLERMQDEFQGSRELVVHRCPKSSSKAENVNYGIGLCTGTIVGILDADHHPLPDVLSEVERLWDRDTVAVQGASTVRNRDTNLLTRFISIEQEVVFSVHHQGGSRWRDFAVFGGSNGYWRRETLAELLMDKEALTEDIDASLRALRAGHRIRFERSVVSTELVPETLGALWLQRLRWAQGWFQCSHRHFYPLLLESGISIRQKAGVMVLLILREAWYYVLPISMVTTLTVFLRSHLFSDDRSQLLLFQSEAAARGAFLLFILVFSTQLLFVYARTPRGLRLAYGWVLLGIVCYLPFIQFLVLVGLTAHFREVYGAHDWVITSRVSKQTSSPEAVDLAP